MGSTVDDGVGDPLDRELRALVASQRNQALVQERRHRHWLVQQAEESGTLRGVLADLADQRAEVQIRTAAATTAGTVVEVGHDFVALAAADGTRQLVVLTALTAIRAAPGCRPVAGDREVGATQDLADALRVLAPERPEVSVVLADGTAVAGTLQSVGGDVVRVAEAGSAAYLPVAAITSVTVA